MVIVVSMYATCCPGASRLVVSLCRVRLMPLTCGHVEKTQLGFIRGENVRILMNLMVETSVSLGAAGDEMNRHHGDLLYRLAQGPARKLLRMVGLPTPVALERGSSVFSDPLLKGQVVGIGPSQPETAQPSSLSTHFIKLGASVVPTPLATATSAPTRLLYDCSKLETIGDLNDMVLKTIKPSITRLPPNSRIVVLSSTHPEAPLKIALAEGLYSMARSLGKELGPLGTTVNVVRLVSPSGPAALSHAVGPCAFFLLPEAAFISGQELCVAEAGLTEDTATLKAPEKVAVVTGAARGIGAAVASRLSSEGFKVVGVDVPACGEALERHMAQLGGEALCEDITSKGAAGRLVETVRARFGQADVLVHNAGITRDRTLRKMSEEQWAAVVRVNLQAILSINEAAGLHGAAALLRPGGSVVLLSSINGIAGAMGQTNYSLTKGALMGYARALAPPLRNHGLTINCIAPGFIETDMVRQMPPLLQLLGRRANALSQGGLPEDVAAAAAFFASHHSRGVTGQVLRVCGLNAVGR